MAACGSCPIFTGATRRRGTRPRLPRCAMTVFPKEPDDEEEELEPLTCVAPVTRASPPQESALGTLSPAADLRRRRQAGSSRRHGVACRGTARRLGSRIRGRARRTASGSRPPRPPRGARPLPAKGGRGGGGGG